MAGFYSLANLKVAPTSSWLHTCSNSQRMGTVADQRAAKRVTSPLALLTRQTAQLTVRLGQIVWTRRMWRGRGTQMDVL